VSTKDGLKKSNKREGGGNVLYQRREKKPLGRLNGGEIRRSGLELRGGKLMKGGSKLKARGGKKMSVID